MVLSKRWEKVWTAVVDAVHMDGLSSSRVFVLNPRKIVSLPRLKKLHLVSVRLEDENSFKNFLLGCPLLEHLHLEKVQRRIIDGSERSKLFVSSPSLKVLQVIDTEGCDLCPWFYVVEAPEIEVLKLEVTVDALLGFSMTTSPVSVRINIVKSQQSLYLPKLFQCIIRSALDVE